MTTPSNEQLAEENRDLLALIAMIVCHLDAISPKTHDFETAVAGLDDGVRMSVERQVANRGL